MLQKILSETGYQHSIQVRNFDFHTIAVLLPSVTDPFYSEILCGVRDYLNVQKFNVMIFSTK